MVKEVRLVGLLAPIAFGSERATRTLQFSCSHRRNSCLPQQAPILQHPLRRQAPTYAHATGRKNTPPKPLHPHPAPNQFCNNPKHVAEPKPLQNALQRYPLKKLAPVAIFCIDSQRGICILMNTAYTALLVSDTTTSHAPRSLTIPTVLPDLQSEDAWWPSDIEPTDCNPQTEAFDTLISHGYQTRTSRVFSSPTACGLQPCPRGRPRLTIASREQIPLY